MRPVGDAISSQGIAHWALVTLKAELVTPKSVRLTRTYRCKSLGQELSTSQLPLRPAACPVPSPDTKARLSARAAWPQQNPAGPMAAVRGYKTHTHLHFYRTPEQKA